MVFLASDAGMFHHLAVAMTWTGATLLSELIACPGVPKCKQILEGRGRPWNTRSQTRGLVTQMTQPRRSCCRRGIA